jgi:gentisate 1,2-dioxygenase
MSTALASLRDAKTLEELYPRLQRLSIGAGWAKPTPSLWPKPHKNFLPMHWRWSDGRAALDAAGRLIGTDLAERRNLILFNPVEGNTYGTVRTLVAAYQMIMPGEKARSHRHTPNALRFILDGEGSYTTVDGARLDMVPNDVLLTPNWCWHGHASEAEGPCAWLDILDAPLVHLLEPMFFEPHPAEFEPVASKPKASPYHFPWSETLRRLDRAAKDPTGRHGRRIELGKPAMTSIALHMEWLEPGERTRPYRTTANQIVCVAQGMGASEIDGERFEWSRGDILAVPCWRPFSHRGSTDAVLFVASDEPLLRGLGWLRDENAD